MAKQAKGQRSRTGERVETRMDLSHLRREVRTALELAIVALAPSDLVDRLAVTAGLFEALSGLPNDSAPVMAMLPAVVTRARSSLDDWQNWHNKYVEKRILRG